MHTGIRIVGTGLSTMKMNHGDKRDAWYEVPLGESQWKHGLTSSKIKDGGCRNGSNTKSENSFGNYTKQNNGLEVDNGVRQKNKSPYSTTYCSISMKSMIQTLMRYIKSILLETHCGHRKKLDSRYKVREWIIHTKHHSRYLHKIGQN